MEFVKFPSLKESKKEVFSYLREAVKCGEKLYLYPITETYGAVFCGEPTDEELLPVILARRLLKRGEPFLFLFTFQEMGKDHLGAVFYDGKDVDGIIVFLQERPIKSLFLSYLKGKQNANIYFYGSDKGYSLVEKVVSSLNGISVTLHRAKPKPITPEEKKALIKEPNPFEFVGKILKRIRKVKTAAHDKLPEKETARSNSLKKTITAVVVLSCLGAGGFYTGEFLYKKMKEPKRAKVSGNKKKAPVFTPYEYNRSAWATVERLLSSCREVVIVYDGRKVEATGECDFPKGGTPLLFSGGKPVAVVYRVIPHREKGKGIDRKSLLERALKYGATGTVKDFYFTVSAPQEVGFVFNSEFPVKVKIEKDRKLYTEVQTR